MTEFLTLDDALRVVSRLGFHLRDAGLLASAIARPATTVFGREVYPTLELKAAALLESIVRHHPFIDGNKRSGWVLTMTFLWMNGVQSDMPSDDAFELVVGVAEGTIDLEPAAAAIAPFLHTR